MALIDIWKSSKSELESKRVQQIIAIAGTGQLKDGEETSTQFRNFLQDVPPQLLQRYAEECLNDPFDDSGFVLQDIVNEVGRRLGFSVENGKYRGRAGQSGHDGLWKDPTGQGIVVEVKTTTAYQIDVDATANYRRQLIKEGTLKEEASSILYVVGRQNTAPFEAQIRGSRHAWDMRMISVKALMSLMVLNEKVDDPKTLQRIYALLVPREFTKLDDIIDIVFSTAEDAKEEAETDREESDQEIDEKPKMKKFTPVAFHLECAKRIEEHLGIKLVRKSKSSFASSDGQTRLICSVSRAYRTKENEVFWYAFHPHQQEFLKDAKSAYVAYGCGSKGRLLLIPRDVFLPLLSKLNVTNKEARSYWHVVFTFKREGVFLIPRANEKKVDVGAFLLPSR